MKKLQSSAILKLVAVFCIGTVATAQQEGPISKDRFLATLDAMQSGKSQRKDAAWCVRLVTELKVDFELTPELEREIRQTGRYLGKQGLDELIKAIRENVQPKARAGIGEKNTVTDSPGTIIDSPGASSTVTINALPVARRIPEGIRPAIIEALSRAPTKAHIMAIINSAEAYRMAQDIYEVLEAAKWDIVGKRIDSYMIGGAVEPGIELNVRGEPLAPKQMVNISKQEPLGILGTILQDGLHFKILLQRERNMEEGLIQIKVGPNQ